ncbi:Fur family transcriptional regulator [Agrococcus jejuensis]|uniref:Zinc uptake regulator, Fur family n=1 Tax=Agrococcus jejuensis TaxID=399736 RepID=A0A1G8D2S0_9MICO|nr:transcriptional repressor [Agrococcus jejuensis]SDH51823.1 zinc uptake regulator, Fur family [Agrococcus jejuensis]
MTDVRRRSTKQREAVREALDAADGFVSAQSLHATMRDGGSTVGLATVYRALATLEQDGAADAVQHDGETVFRACTPTHHHHLICRECGRTVELEADPVEAWTREVAAKHGYTDPHHTIEITGICDRHASGGAA